MAPQKGKVATKGQKQIVEENVETLTFYKTMILGANAIYLAVMIIFFEFTTWFNIMMFILSSIIYIASIQFMSYMARSTLGEKNQVVDSGVDLNMVGGIAEHVKDIIILTAGSQLLSLLSNYFWLLMLLAPIRALYFLWKNILGPYLFQESTEQEVDEKKQKKMDRKMRRLQH